MLVLLVPCLGKLPHACLPCQSCAQATLSLSCRYALLVSCLGKPSFPFMFVLSDPVLRQTLFMHVCLISLILRHTISACLHCQSHAQANFFMKVFLVKPNAQKNPHIFLALLVSCLGKTPYVCLSYETQAQANPLFVGLDPWIQEKPYNYALANHHLLVNFRFFGLDTPLYGFQQYTLGPNNTFIMLNNNFTITQIFSSSFINFSIQFNHKLFTKQNNFFSFDKRTVIIRSLVVKLKTQSIRTRIELANIKALPGHDYNTVS